MAGQTKTELVHRERFSAFEQVVENRDLIQSYIPQFDGASDKPVGVFEIYSDATPFLAELRRTESTLWLLISGSLGGLLVVLFLIVRRADGIIRQQAIEKHKTQQQLSQSEKMASLGQLVAGVTHQLNTPIGFSHSNVSLAIASLKELAHPLQVAARLSDLVKSLPADQDSVVLKLNNSRQTLAGLSCRGDEAEELSMMLGDVLQGLEQMRELVENLRDFTRLDRSKVIDADINAALKNVIYIAKSSIPPRITVIQELGELPSLSCNPSQLNQVFLNLITNAAHAIPAEGNIRIRSSCAGSEIAIEISDTGTGIPADVLPHIFETFYTTKARGVGTGLGLSIARDIIQSHGGSISVDSQDGVGTSFRITLPLLAPETIQTL